MPVTSMRTPRADVDAPFAPSTNVFSRRETCTAAVVIPIIEAETDRGSISNEDRESSNDTSPNDEYVRNDIRRQGIEKDSRTAL